MGRGSESFKLKAKACFQRTDRKALKVQIEVGKVAEKKMWVRVLDPDICVLKIRDRNGFFFFLGGLP